MMFLKTLLLHNFRNYTSFKVNFSPHLNIIFGENAIGKTNLLEAINLISTGKSFRTLNLKELIKHQKRFFFIEALIEDSGISQIIKIYYDGKTKKITHNANVYPTFTSLLGVLPSSMHTPDDINLIKGKPQLRRSFLNLHLAQKDPLYVHHYLRFSKALKHRNHLLKTKKNHLLKPFDIELSKSGGYLTYIRKLFIEELKDPIFQILQNLSTKKSEATIKYQSSIELKDDVDSTSKAYLKDLTKNKQKDLDFKTTLLGPHRDDFSIYIDGKAAKNFASEGQKEMLLYALRFAEWEKLSSRLDKKALFLIDDLEAHLDEAHKENLKNALKSFSQVFITMPKTGESFNNAHFINLNTQKL